MPLCDHAFTVDPPRERRGQWFTAVRGQQAVHLGPFASETAAMLGLHQLFQRWRRHARRRGGFLWRQTAFRWVVTLPVGVPCAGLPFASEACTRALPGGGAT